MNKELQKKIDAEMARHERKLTELAAERMGWLKFYWQSNFSKRNTLKLIFGMGTCGVWINGHQVDFNDNCTAGFYRGRWLPSLAEIGIAIRDVEEITNDYRNAGVEDLEVRGI